jgi:hypothetical protein
MMHPQDKLDWIRRNVDPAHRDLKVPVIGRFHVHGDGMIAWHGPPMTDRQIRSKFDPPHQVCQYIRQRLRGARAAAKSDKHHTVLKARWGLWTVTNLFGNDHFTAGISGGNGADPCGVADFICHRLREMAAGRGGDGDDQ